MPAAAMPPRVCQATWSHCSSDLTERTAGSAQSRSQGLRSARQHSGFLRSGLGMRDCQPEKAGGAVKGTGPGRWQGAWSRTSGGRAE